MIKRGSRDRVRFLEAWALGIRKVIANEMGFRIEYVFPPHKGKIQPVNGPRVAGLKLYAGNKIGQVVSLLQRNSMANIHASIPGEDDCPNAINPKAPPLVGFEGRWYVIQLSWSDRLAERDIQTNQLLRGSAWAELETSGTHWLAGLESRYEPVYQSLDIKKGSPHFFFIGTTQAGKSTALENAVAQLALCPDNKFMFIDAVKKFRDFGPTVALKQCIGPPALDVELARAALIWLRDEMDSRFAGVSEDYRIICIIDELPGLSADKTCVEIIKAVASAGAQCKIHLFLAAQHATAENLGPFAGTVKANVGGRMVFHTTQVSGSVEGLGDKRAKALGVPGDCWCLNANMPPTRIQASYFPKEFLEGEKKWNFGSPEMESWPKISREVSNSGKGNGFSEDVIAAAVAHRLKGRIAGEQRGYGRSTIQEMFGLRQNEAVRLVQLTDVILDGLRNVGRSR